MCLCLVQMSLLYHVASKGCHPVFPEHLSPLCKAFLSRCFVAAPSDRASAAELLDDPWLQSASVVV